jgi:hypothetical protein
MLKPEQELRERKVYQKWQQWRAQRIMKRSQYRKELHELPTNLYDYWKSSAKNEFNGIPGDAVFFARAAEGLMVFFDCVATSGKPCALPSLAVDSVWHAWQRLAPLKLDAFCLKHFGRVIPHLERAVMPGRMEDAIAASLVRARELEGLRPEGPRLPSLFLLDRKLRMPNGFGYTVLRGRPGYGELDARGRLDPLVSCPPALEAAGLLAAGLITSEAYAAYMERAARRPEGSSCGSGCGSSVSCDAGSSSCDGGSSCGSSCGGSGCGGGGD